MISAFAAAHRFVEKLPMGDWTVTISGTGPHHNTGNDTDADRIAVRLTQAFAVAGHRNLRARFTAGIADNLLESVPVSRVQSPPLAAR